MSEADAPQILETPGSPLHCEVRGTPDRPAILFVHGLLSSRSHWLPNLPAFLPAYRAVIPELLGHGRSPAADDEAAYHPDRYVEYFEAIRKVAGVEQWYVVGQSLGAALSLRYSLAHPERVIALVITNSFSAFAPPGGIRDPETAQRFARELIEGGTEGLAKHPLNPGRARALSEEVRAAFAQDVQSHDPRGIAMTILHTGPPSSVRDRLDGNQLPILLIAGDREERFVPFREFAETVPNLQVVRVDAPHAVNLVAVEAFNRETLAFFAEHAPTRVG